MKRLCLLLPERAFLLIFTDCPCCAFGRGAALGALIAFGLVALIA